MFYTIRYYLLVVMLSSLLKNSLYLVLNLFLIHPLNSLWIIIHFKKAYFKISKYI